MTGVLTSLPRWCSGAGLRRRWGECSSKILTMVTWPIRPSAGWAARTLSSHWTLTLVTCWPPVTSGKESKSWFYFRVFVIIVIVVRHRTGGSHQFHHLDVYFIAKYYILIVGRPAVFCVVCYVVCMQVRFAFFRERRAVGSPRRVSQRNGRGAHAECGGVVPRHAYHSNAHHSGAPRQGMEPT